MSLLSKRSGPLARLAPWLLVALAAACSQSTPVEVMTAKELRARSESSSKKAVLLNFWASW